MWRRLEHSNIVPFIGVTQTPIQFVSEWMPNGTLTEYVNENANANRIGLVGSSSVATASVMTFLFQAIGCGRGPHLPPCKTYYTRRLERGRYLPQAVLIFIDDFWPD